MSSYVLLSGGLDSCVLAAHVKARVPYLEAITFHYGSTHETREYKAAIEVAEKLKIPISAIKIPKEYFTGGESALMGEGFIPVGEYEFETGPSNTVVPGRNLLFLAIASARALATGGGAVYIAVHATDHMTWAYPDCSPEAIGGFTAAEYAASYHKVRVSAPFMEMTKTDIVKLAGKMDPRPPLDLTWSCYRGGDVSCGTCPTCLERRYAFTHAGFIDPVAYMHPQSDEKYGGLNRW